MIVLLSDSDSPSRCFTAPVLLPLVGWCFAQLAAESRSLAVARSQFTSAITTLGAHIAQKREMRANETRLTTDWDQEVWSIHAGCTLLQ